jgi:hypothetical protein
MAIFDLPDVQIAGQNYQPDGSKLLNTAGFNSGDGILGRAGGFLNNILGINKANSFYDEFLNSFLQTGNSLPLNNLWLVFIQDLPPAGVISESYITNEFNSLGSSWYEKASKESKRPRGVIIAQGVKHVGDGIKYSRDGYKNTGLITGIYSNGRADFNELSISFLENNISFVDYALRPWSVAVAHEGLTNSSVVANSITVWHLGKMGERTNFARRKVIKYHGCFPTTIDQQEYNYGGNGEPKMLRQVSFGYRYYTMESADNAVLDLITYGNQERSILNSLKGFINKQAENALSDLKSQFGANSVSQYLNNIVERAKSFGESLVSNTVQGVVTNVAGGIQGAIDGAIRDVTSETFNAQNSLVNRVSETVNSITSGNSNRDVPRGTNVKESTDIIKQENNSVNNLNNRRLNPLNYTEKNVNQEDTVTFLRSSEEEAENREIVSIELNKTINSSDTPNNLSTDITNLEGGGISINRSFASSGSNNDTPNFLQNNSLLYYFERNINEDDTPRFVSIPSEFNKKINQNDNVTNLSTNTNTDKQIGGFSNAVSETSERSVNYTENSLILEKEVNSNDSNIGDELVEYVEKEINSNDSDIEVDSSLININQNDSTPSQSIKYVDKKVNENDSNIEVVSNLVNVAQNDSNPNQSIKYVDKKVNENDSNIEVVSNLVNVAQNDSNPSQSIKYIDKKVNENDSNTGQNVNFLSKKVNENPIE